MKFEKRKSTVRRMSVKLAVENDVKDRLIEILKDVRFDLINVPLSTKKGNVNITGNGYTQIGFVNGFDAETESFDLVVFENRFEAVKAMGDVRVSTRQFKNRDGEITKIISLDLLPETSTK